MSLYPICVITQHQGQDITDLPTKDIVALGITMVPEGRRVFADLTVEENLRLGAYTRRGPKAVNRDLELVHSTFPRPVGSGRPREGSFG